MPKVLDAKGLEQSAAYRIDRHPQVVAFAKNEGMGFGIPYLHDGRMRDYLPDFLVRLQGEGRYLVLETKGYDPLKEVKQAAAKRWVAAVNADGRHGQWQYRMVTTADEVSGAINDAVAALQEQNTPA